LEEGPLAALCPKIAKWAAENLGLARSCSERAPAHAGRRQVPSLLRHPRLAHAFVRALAARKIDGIVGECLGSKPRDGEARIEFEPRTGSFARFFKTAKVRQDRGEKEMRMRRIRIALYRPVQLSDRSLIAAAVQFGGSDEVHPDKCASIARADAQRFDDMPLGLLVAAQ
jgi:hypothetical protein